MLPVHVGGVPMPARRTVLFLIAILLPCGVLVALTTLMMGQQRELTEKRLTDRRRAVTAAASSELASQLERLRVQALSGRRDDADASPLNGMVVLAAPLDAGRLRLPWQTDASARPSDADAFQQAMRAAERAENIAGAAQAAPAQFQSALAAARSPAQGAAARLGLARALTAAGRVREAAAADAELLRTSLSVRDDQGIPFALYGAHRLIAIVGGAAAQSEIVPVLRGCVSASPPLPPAALYTMRDVAQSLADHATGESSRAAAREVAAQAARLGRDREQAQALAEALPTLFPSGRSPQTSARWELFGPADNRWLVSAVPAGMHVEPGVVVLRFQMFGARMSQLPLFRDEGIRLVEPGSAAGGERLSGGLEGFSLQMLPARADVAEREDRLQRPFYLAVLLLVVGIACCGGYFFWYDVQRELRTADMRSQFVSSVSHELKTPLTAIRMFAETLLMARSRPETREEYLHTIVNESERLTRLINNVLDFSKIEQGTKIYRMEPRELTEIIESVARVLEYPLLQQGFALDLELERGIIVLADRDAMQQALLNLLSNAMKYSGDSRTIRLSLSASDDEACVSVVDRGCGIPAGEHSKIFQKFYRAERAQQDHIPGTGLGLTIVEHVVAAHRGRVAVTSTPGNGSTFSLILPVHRIERRPGQFDPSLGHAHASHSRH